MKPTALPVRSVLLTAAVTALVMLVLDLTFLGVVARDFYNRELGDLRRPEVYLPAAMLFYVVYVGATLRFAVLGSHSRLEAFGRGARLGLVVYAGYELTNWAVIRDWPALLVPVDLAWGVALTAVTSWAGFVALERSSRRVRS